MLEPCYSRGAWRLFAVTIGMSLGLSAASMCPDPVIPCERRSFFTNISAQVDFEAPKQGAIVGTYHLPRQPSILECRVTACIVIVARSLVFYLRLMICIHVSPQARTAE